MKRWYLEAQFLEGVVIFFVVQPLLLIIPLYVFFTELFRGLF